MKKFRNKLFATLITFSLSFPLFADDLKVADDFNEGDILSAETFNQIFDKDLDKNMVRTKNRPVASGALKLSHALVFSFLLFLSGCLSY